MKTLLVALLFIWALLATSTAHAQQQQQQQQPAAPQRTSLTPDADDAYKRGDFATAFRLYRLPAEQGDLQAQTRLGVIYASGNGVQQDYAQALQWFHKAADGEHPLAQYNLGVCYERGMGVPQDYVQASQWYRKGADHGNVRAQYNLGGLYERGQGVPQSFVEAQHWYRKAADQGDASAQYAIGVLYGLGKGMPPDAEEAKRWFRKAADLGNVDAQKALASFSPAGPVSTPAATRPTSQPAEALQQRIADARALTIEQWAPNLQLITKIEIGYKCGVLDQTSADVGVNAVINIMDNQKIQNGLIDDNTLKIRIEMEKAIQNGKLAVSSDSDFCSKFFSNPADKARLRQIVSLLMP